MKPTTRVLAVLELLQAHGQVSGAEIARRLDVDVRTVRRYIAMLEEMGIPVLAERGRAGGYALVAGFKLPPMMFSEDEALALSVGLLAAKGLGLERAAPAIAGAQAKLERTMPAGLRQRVRAIGETVQLDLRRAAGATGNAFLPDLSVAARAGRRVRLDYADASGQASMRALDPYGLAYHDGCWYAVGWCHLRAAVRSFRLDRIRALAPLDESFARPQGFDALAWLVRAVATPAPRLDRRGAAEDDPGNRTGAVLRHHRGVRAGGGWGRDAQPVGRYRLVRAAAGQCAVRLRDQAAGAAARGGAGVCAASACAALAGPAGIRARALDGFHKACCSRALPRAARHRLLRSRMGR